MSAPKVLVAVASKHGSTREIAEQIGNELAKRKLEVTVSSVQDVNDIKPYAGVVLGSAIYAGRWLKPAREFVDEFAKELAKRPTWLFSSGPIGDPPKPDNDRVVQIDTIIAITAAQDHKIFAGKLDKSLLSFAERAVVSAVGGKEGDFRDWRDIKSWALHVANQLKKQVS